MIRRFGLPALCAILVSLACFSSEPPSGPTKPSFALRTTTPVIVAAGDIAGCGPSYRDERTADLIRQIQTEVTSLTVLALGDLVYPDATPSNWANCYDPSWGSFKGKTRPVIGSHDYADDKARSYINYWGGLAGPAGKFYYSFNIGSWHIVVLNDANTALVSTRPGTPQDVWLQADLAANTRPCVLAAFHNPRWASNSKDPVPTVPPNYTSYLWNRLIAVHADLILTASVHNYSRFKPARTDGTPDPQGIPQYTAGTGGSAQGADKWVHPLVVYRAPNPTYGVLQVTLFDGSYKTVFRSIGGQSLDPVTKACHGA
jgi:hypothetical protein